MKSPDDHEKPFILQRESYLAMIKNSPGTQMFRSVIALYDGKEQDVLRDGELSCAYFVSSVLRLFDLVSGKHVVVASTIEDMRERGWVRLEDGDIRPGAVVLWKSKRYADGEEHAHIGFALGKGKAVSTSATWGEVVKHRMGWLRGIRHVEALYWHPKLDAPTTDR